MTAFDNPPVFSFGFERSGTTLLSMILGAHPELAVPFSTAGLWYRFNDLADQYADLGDATNLHRLVSDIAADERLKMWDRSPSCEQIVPYVQTPSYAEVVAAFHRWYAEQHGKRGWALHDIATIHNLPLVNEWFPDARFIHIVRDVRDVAFSHKSYKYGSSNASEVALAWRETVGQNLAMGDILGSRRYTLVQYEQLLGDPEATAKSLCEFLGIDYDPKMLHYKDDVAEKVPAEKRDLWPALTGNLDKTKIGRWQSGLRSYEIAAVEEISIDLMRRCGYELDKPRRSMLKELYYLGSVLTRGGRLRRLRRKVGF